MMRTGTRKKGKKKVKKEKKIVKSKSKYENEIVLLNRELGAIRSQVGPIQDLFFDWEDKFHFREKELQDIIESLEFECQVQQNDIDDYDETSLKFMKNIEEQQSHYQEIIQQIEEKNEKERKILQSDVYNQQVKLIILGNFQHQAEQYREEEEALQREKNEQEKRQKMELYEAEKRHRRQSYNLRVEYKEHMKKVEMDLEEQIKEQMATDDNAALNQIHCKMSQSGEQYHKLMQKFDQLKKQELDAKLGVQIVEEEIGILQRKLKTRTSNESAFSDAATETDGFIDRETDYKSLFREAAIDTSDLSTIGIQSQDEDGKAKDGLEIIDELSSLVEKALGLKVRESNELEILIGDVDEDPLANLHIQREEILTTIATIIDTTLGTLTGNVLDGYQEGKYSLDEACEVPKIRIPRRKLLRRDLWRNWRLNIQTLGRRDVPLSLLTN